MSSTRESRSDEELLHDFLLMVGKDIHRVASESGELIREAATDDSPVRLWNRLVELHVVSWPKMRIRHEASRSG